jgi:hypothetical protein
VFPGDRAREAASANELPGRVRQGGIVAPGAPVAKGRRLGSEVKSTNGAETKSTGVLTTPLFDV